MNEKKQIEQTQLSIGQLAKRWGISPVFVRRLIWSKRLVATRFGRILRVQISEIERFENEADKTA